MLTVKILYFMSFKIIIFKLKQPIKFIQASNAVLLSLFTNKHDFVIKQRNDKAIYLIIIHFKNLSCQPVGSTGLSVIRSIMCLVCTRIVVVPPHSILFVITLRETLFLPTEISDYLWWNAPLQGNINCFFFSWVFKEHKTVTSRETKRKLSANIVSVLFWMVWQQCNLMQLMKLAKQQHCFFVMLNQRANECENR